VSEPTKVGDPMPMIVAVVLAVMLMALTGFWVGVGFWLAWRLIAA